MSELVQRMREHGELGKRPISKTDVHRAADRIEQLEAQNAELREAIQSALDVVTEEINPSNYDHEVVCKVANEMDQALRILIAALSAANKGEKG